MLVAHHSGYSLRKNGSHGTDYFIGIHNWDLLYMVNGGIIYSIKMGQEKDSKYSHSRESGGGGGGRAS